MTERARKGQGKWRGIWRARRITPTRCTDGEASDGLVFANRSRLRVLQRRGYLTLLDATHCTNEMGWLLYTLMVRDERAKWIPAAHVLTAKADSDVLELGLKQVSTPYITRL